MSLFISRKKKNNYREKLNKNIKNNFNIIKNYSKLLKICLIATPINKFKKLNILRNININKIKIYSIDSHT